MGREYIAVVSGEPPGGSSGGVRGWLLRRKFVRGALEDKADLSMFKGPPSGRLAFGLVLIGLSYVVGWPAIAAVGAIAVWVRSGWLAVVGGPACYGLSWAIFTIGMWFAGTDSLKYGRAFGRWMVRRLAEKYLVR